MVRLGSTNKPFRFLFVALMAMVISFGAANLSPAGAQSLGDVLGPQDISLGGGVVTVDPIAGGAEVNIGGIRIGQNGVSIRIPGYEFEIGRNGISIMAVPHCESPEGTVGAAICNVSLASYYFPRFLRIIAYGFGMFLGVMAIIKLKEHVENPNNVPLSEPVKRFLAGGAFFALPTVTMAAYVTVARFIDGPVYRGFSGEEVSGGGLDAMLVALVGNIWEPMHVLFKVFCMLAGTVLIMIGISRLLKSSQEGPRGPAGLGTMATFLIGGALLSYDSMMSAFTGSFFATNQVSTYATLQFSAGVDPASLNHLHSVISSVLAFMMIIGWISFIRGWFIIRGVTEGTGQASLMSGMTHVLGGALAVNLGAVMNAVQNTFGIMGYGIKFS